MSIKHKMYFTIFLNIFIFSQFVFIRNVSAADEPFKYILSIKKAEVRLKSDDKSIAFAQIEKNVYVKSFGWRGNWLLIGLEYNNLFAISFNDMSIHFSGWVYKEDFQEVDTSQINQNSNIYSTSISNTVYIPQDDEIKDILKEKWEKGERLFSEEKNIEVFNLPNYNYDSNKTVLSDRSSFVVNSECKDWQNLDWLEIVYSSGENLKRGWVKKLQTLKPYEEFLLEEAKKEIEKEKKEKAEQIKKTIIEIKYMMQEIDKKKKDVLKVTGREDIDNRIKELEIEKLTDELQNSIRKLDSLQISN